MCKRRGIRFTGLVRTVVDLTDVASRDVVVAGFEHAIRMSKRNRKRIAEKLAELEDGRRSTSVLHELIERRADHEPATENKLEAWCDDLLFKNGIRARRQFVVAHEGRFVARVDFALPELFYAIEFEGHGTHSSRSQKRKDALRKLGLNEVGWDVGVLTYEDVMSEGPAVQKLVRAVELRRTRFAKPIDARPLQQLPLFGT